MIPDDLICLRKLCIGFATSRAISTENTIGVFDCLKKASSASEKEID